MRTPIAASALAALLSMACNSTPHDTFLIAYHRAGGVTNQGVSTWSLDVAGSLLRTPPWSPFYFCGCVKDPQNFRGLSVARDNDGVLALLGITENDAMKIYIALGTQVETGGRFDDALARYTLPGVNGRGAIASMGQGRWLVAYRDAAGAVQLRELNTSTHAFSPPITFSPQLTNNSGGATGPALAYGNDRIVLVWGQTSGNRQFRYAAATHVPGTTQATVTAQGDIPAISGIISSFQASPSLAHDGVATFYLAAMYRSGTSGLTQDLLNLYLSPDGQAWTRIAGPPAASSFPNGAHAAIAALPSGNLGLFVVSNRTAAIHRRLTGNWVQDSVSGPFDPETEDLAIIRWRYFD